MHGKVKQIGFGSLLQMNIEVIEHRILAGLLFLAQEDKEEYMGVQEEAISETIMERHNAQWEKQKAWRARASRLNVTQIFLGTPLQGASKKGLGTFLKDIWDYKVDLVSLQETMNKTSSRIFGHDQVIGIKHVRYK
ncbi:hypothetical protein ACJX0J_011556, partial [Zea mays]